MDDNMKKLNNYKKLKISGILVIDQYITIEINREHQKIK